TASNPPYFSPQDRTRRPPCDALRRAAHDATEDCAVPVVADDREMLERRPRPRPIRRRPRGFAHSWSVPPRIASRGVAVGAGSAVAPRGRWAGMNRALGMSGGGHG